MKEIKKVSFDDIYEFGVKYFPGLKKGNNPFEKIIACYIDEILVGFIYSSVIYERAEIEYFVVREDYRGSGLAGELLDFLISEISNGENISLEVRCNNERALNFYLKNGFKKVGIRKKYYDSEDAYLMVKELR